MRRLLALLALVVFPAASAASTASVARHRLATLRTAAPLTMAGYNRELFPHWRDPDGNGCNARQDTLIRYGRHVRVGDHCRILGGSWFDPYGGGTYTVARSLDCDHLVPLADAWRSGARRWTLARRTRFANDPLVLRITTASLNRQKGDSSPDEWKPPRRAFWLTYAARWILVKVRYHLAVTGAERRALRVMIR